MKKKCKHNVYVLKKKMCLLISKNSTSKNTRTLDSSLFNSLIENETIFVTNETKEAFVYSILLAKIEPHSAVKVDGHCITLRYIQLRFCLCLKEFFFVYRIMQIMLGKNASARRLFKCLKNTKIYGLLNTFIYCLF